MRNMPTNLKEKLFKWIKEQQVTIKRQDINENHF